MDARTDNVKTVYPLQTKFVGGIKSNKKFSSLLFAAPIVVSTDFIKYGTKLYSVPFLGFANTSLRKDTGGFAYTCMHRGSYMSAHVLLNLLNELGKRDKMRGLPSILSLFRNEFNKFNNTRA